MPLEITIPDDDTKYVIPSAVAELQSSIKHYSDDLLQEASRLEATAKTTSGNPEITSSMIKDADLLLRRGYRRPRKKKWLVAAQIVATVSGILTGLLAKFDRFKEPAWLIAFVAILTIAITTTVIIIVSEQK